MKFIKRTSGFLKSSAYSSDQSTERRVQSMAFAAPETVSHDGNPPMRDTNILADFRRRMKYRTKSHLLGTVEEITCELRTASMSLVEEYTTTAYAVNVSMPAVSGVFSSEIDYGLSVNDLVIFNASAAYLMDMSERKGEIGSCLRTASMAITNKYTSPPGVAEHSGEITSGTWGDLLLVISPNGVGPVQTLCTYMIYVSGIQALETDHGLSNDQPTICNASTTSTISVSRLINRGSNSGLDSPMEMKSIVCTSPEQKNNTNVPPTNIIILSVRLQDDQRVLLILHQRGSSIVLCEEYGESISGYDVYGSYLHFPFSTDQWKEHCVGPDLDLFTDINFRIALLQGFEIPPLHSIVWSIHRLATDILPFVLPTTVHKRSSSFEFGSVDAHPCFWKHLFPNGSHFYPASLTTGDILKRNVLVLILNENVYPSCHLHYWSQHHAVKLPCRLPVASSAKRHAARGDSVPMAIVSCDTTHKLSVNTLFHALCGGISLWSSCWYVYADNSVSCHDFSTSTGHRVHAQVGTDKSGELRCGTTNVIVFCYGCPVSDDVTTSHHAIPSSSSEDHAVCCEFSHAGIIGRIGSAEHFDGIISPLDAPHQCFTINDDSPCLRFVNYRSGIPSYSYLRRSNACAHRSNAQSIISLAISFEEGEHLPSYHHPNGFIRLIRDASCVSCASYAPLVLASSVYDTRSAPSLSRILLSCTTLTPESQGDCHIMRFIDDTTPLSVGNEAHSVNADMWGGMLFDLLGKHAPSYEFLHNFKRSTIWKFISLQPGNTIASTTQPNQVFVSVRIHSCMSCTLYASSHLVILAIVHWINFWEQTPSHHMSASCVLLGDCHTIECSAKNINELFVSNDARSVVIIARLDGEHDFHSSLSKLRVDYDPLRVKFHSIYFVGHMAHPIAQTPNVLGHQAYYHQISTESSLLLGIILPHGNLVFIRPIVVSFGALGTFTSEHSSHDFYDQDQFHDQNVLNIYDQVQVTTESCQVTVDLLHTTDSNVSSSTVNPPSFTQTNFVLFGILLYHDLLEVVNCLLKWGALWGAMFTINALASRGVSNHRRFRFGFRYVTNTFV